MRTTNCSTQTACSSFSLRLRLFYPMRTEDEVYLDGTPHRSTRVCNQIICTKIEKLLRNFYKFIFRRKERRGRGDKLCAKVARILHAKWLRCSEGCVDFPAFYPAARTCLLFISLRWNRLPSQHPLEESFLLLPFFPRPPRRV